MSNKVLKHPDKDDIIKKLLNGESLRDVERWLKKKYPRKSRLHISYMTLQKFRKENLNIEGQVLDEIKNKRQKRNKIEDAKETQIILQNNNAYQEKINEIVDSELDVTRRLLEMDKLISSRIEYYYNILNMGGDIKDDKIFLEYVNTMKSIMQDWKKYIEGVADKKVEHNININIVNQQITIIKNVVCDVISEIQPSLIPKFVEKLNNKLNEFDYEENILNLNKLEVSDE